MRKEENYFKDVCEAIAYLHRNEIMHRDIKVIVFFILSLKIYSLQIKIKLNFVILVLQLFLDKERHYVEPINICHLKWFKIDHTIIK